MIAFLDRLGFSRLTSIEDVQSLTPAAFEYFTKFLMEREGFRYVRVTRKQGRYHADGGVDLTAMKDGRAVCVQCKRWLTSKRGGYMPIEQVRALGGAMKRDGITEGLFVSTLPFGMHAKDEALALYITLWGPEEISRMMQRINAGWGAEEGRSVLGLWLALPWPWRWTLEVLLWLLVFVLVGRIMRTA